MLPEGRFDLVAPSDPSHGIVALHPHPDMGGDRRNLVVEAVFRSAVDAGLATIRFDFSSSDLAIAAAETVDALDLLPAGIPLAVIGYSFGAAVAAMVEDPRLIAWALIAPPFGMLVPGADLPIAADPRPKLVLVPSHDQYCPPSVAAAETERWSTTYVEAIAGADHFLAGASAEAARRAVQFVTS